MLKINITQTMLIFKELTDLQQEKINNIAPLKYMDYKRQWYIEGRAELLYHVLYKLAFDFDIEIV